MPILSSATSSTKPSFRGSALGTANRSHAEIRGVVQRIGRRARAIASGFDADVAILSLEGDIDKLVKAGLVRKDWKAGPHHGMITRSLVVIGYRAGNLTRSTTGRI